MDEVDKNIREGILGLGRVAPNPNRQPGDDGHDEEQEDLGKPGEQHAGSRELRSGGVAPDVGGTRNYHRSGGATGGDLGNRPE